MFKVMHYNGGEQEKVVCVERWEDNTLVLELYQGEHAGHTNHALAKGGPEPSR